MRASRLAAPFAAPFAACKDATGKRWVITGWERCGRAWGAR